MLIAPSSEELTTAADAADIGSVVSDELRPVAGGADADLFLSEATGAVDDSGSASSEEICALAAGADRGCVSVLLSVSSGPGDDVSCANVAAVSDRRPLDVRCLPLRNRRHVWELCSASGELGPTAGLAPSASLVSTSSCPLTGN